jgi:hypothetical protein
MDDKVLSQVATLDRLFSVTMTLYKDPRTGAEQFFICTTDAHGDGVRYSVQPPFNATISRFEQMMKAVTNEMKIHLRERPPLRSNDPRQSSITEGEGTPE